MSRARELIATLTTSDCHGCRSLRSTLSIAVGDLNAEAHKASRSNNDRIDWKSRIAEAKTRVVEVIELAELHLAEAHAPAEAGRS